MTRRMEAVLRVLAAADGPRTPNEIAYACGFQPGQARQAHDGRTMGPAVHVTSAITSLGRSGFVSYARRRDGRSGSAYAITKLGRQEVR